MRNWSKAGLLVGLALVALAVACGSDDKPNSVAEPTAAGAESSDGGGASLSSVAPDTFLTFEGKRYRLVDLQQADFVDESEFQEIGEATAADIDQDDLTVYRRTGDSEAVFTYAKARPESEEVQAVEGEDATTPALWYRWVPEP